MYRHSDKKQGITTSKGERTIDPLSKTSLYLIDKLDQNYPQLPILIHWEFYKWDKDLPIFSKLFNMYPKHIFIINHMGFGNSGQVETLIQKHSNIYFTISKRNTKFNYFMDSKTFQGPPLLDDKKIINESWKKLFIKYEDRFLFATDSHKDYMWNNYNEIVRDYRLILNQLPKSTHEKIAYQNAEKIFHLNY